MLSSMAEKKCIRHDSNVFFDGFAWIWAMFDSKTRTSISVYAIGYICSHQTFQTIVIFVILTHPFPWSYLVVSGVLFITYDSVWKKKN